MQVTIGVELLWNLESVRTNNVGITIGSELGADRYHFLSLWWQDFPPLSKVIARKGMTFSDFDVGRFMWLFGLIEPVICIPRSIPLTVMQTFICVYDTPATLNRKNYRSLSVVKDINEVMTKVALSRHIYCVTQNLRVEHLPSS